MSNMSYCRFQNTSLDFQDCISAMNTMLENQSETEVECMEEEAERFKDLSVEERDALKTILEHCESFMSLADELLEKNQDDE